jgi:hypothetical protein
MTKKEKRQAEKEMRRTTTTTRKRAGNVRTPMATSLEEDDGEVEQGNAKNHGPAAQEDAGSEDGPDMGSLGLGDDY